MDRMTSENAGEDLYDHRWAFGDTKAVTGLCMSFKGQGGWILRVIGLLSRTCPYRRLCPSKLTSVVGPIIGCSCFSRRLIST
jgi:hypothetical protein